MPNKSRKLGPRRLISDLSDSDIRRRRLSDDDVRPARESEQLALTDPEFAKMDWDVQQKYHGVTYNDDYQAGLDRRFGSKRKQLSTK